MKWASGESRGSVRTYVALGANVGDTVVTIARAVADIEGSSGCQLQKKSALYLTAPVDTSGPDFVNAVIELNTCLSAPLLLLLLQKIEQTAGRERPWRNAPRTLDLDILLYGEGRIESPQLCIPHPRMWDRAFVMMPLAEIAPQWSQAAGAPALQGQRIQRMPASPFW